MEWSEAKTSRRAVGLHAVNIARHLAADQVPVIGLPDPHIETADEGQLVAVLFGKKEWIVVLRLPFYGVERVEACSDDHRHCLGRAATTMEDHRQIIAVEEGHKLAKYGKINSASTFGEANSPFL